MPSRVVVGNFDVEGPFMIVRPLETHTPLLIDADAELPFAVTTERFKAIAGQKASGPSCQPPIPECRDAAPPDP